MLDASLGPRKSGGGESLADRENQRVDFRSLYFQRDRCKPEDVGSRFFPVILLRSEG
jgi:hypothetical protein